MKVLICIPCLLTGGTEIQTLNLVHALVEGGHEVVTACYFEHDEYMIDQYEAAGCRIVLFSHEGNRVEGIAGIKFLWRHFKMLICEFHPDVAHVQYMAPGAQPILILKLLGVKTIVATAHTNSDIYRSLRLIHFLQKHVLRAWTCITLSAEKGFFGSSQLYSCDMKIGKRNHFTIYNSLPYGMQFCGHRYRNQIHTLGVVSRLEEIKGMDLIVPAFAEVHKLHPEVRLIIVGDGSLKELMLQQAQDLCVSKCIEWAGRQPQSELSKWYGKMDVVLMPSRSEGFGLTAIEAMVNGCVMIASNTGGLSEIVKDGEVGLLHEVGNYHDLATKIMQLINDSEQYVMMQVHLEDYVQQYNFDNYSKIFNNLYTKFNIWL